MALRQLRRDAPPLALHLMRAVIARAVGMHFASRRLGAEWSWHPDEPAIEPGALDALSAHGARGWRCTSRARRRRRRAAADRARRRARARRRRRRGAAARDAAARLLFVRLFLPRAKPPPPADLVQRARAPRLNLELLLSARAGYADADGVFMTCDRTIAPRVARALPARAGATARAKAGKPTLVHRKDVPPDARVLLERRLLAPFAATGAPTSTPRRPTCLVVDARRAPAHAVRAAPIWPDDDERLHAWLAERGDDGALGAHRVSLASPSPRAAASTSRRRST